MQCFFQILIFIDFASFIYNGLDSGTGPTNFAFRSNVDGFTNDIGTLTASGTTIDFSGLSGINSSIEFYLYA